MIINEILLTMKFYSFFTKFSLMENYGFISGIFNRLFRKILPEIPAEDTFEFYLRAGSNQKQIAEYTKTIQKLLTDPTTSKSISNELDNAISGLSSRVISLVYDNEFQSIFERLDIDSSCYSKLLYRTSIIIN